MSDEQDRALKLNQVIHALRTDQSVVVVDYAYNTLLKLGEDPVLKDRICDELLKNLVHFSTMLLVQRGDWWDVWDRGMVFENLLHNGENPTRNDRIRKELLKIRDKETVPIAVRVMADGIIWGISPPEYSWSPQRIEFLRDMIARPDIDHSLKEFLETGLRHVADAKR
jgi:hypothetical protein